MILFVLNDVYTLGNIENGPSNRDPCNNFLTSCLWLFQGSTLGTPSYSSGLVAEYERNLFFFFLNVINLV